VKTTNRSEQEAVSDARRKKLLQRGWRDDAFISDAFEGQSDRNDYTCCNFVLPDGDTDREIKVYLTDTPRGRLLLRHACQAVGALAKFEAGEIAAADFIGQHVRAKIDIEKGRRGYPDRNVIVDVAAADTSSVVNLRSA
jgi:hypothetical protein